ncbi:hypothetical protein [Burkholderia stagnalis]|uniref:hypothetical protein n=1 Tax=Burkholderia stagnalis TaxID=1503054 RepID=UPI0012DA96D2|nr:hypothetical protein [Burkholderia stagnalis]
MKRESRARSARLAANICECARTAKYAPFSLDTVRGTRERARIPAGIRPIVERYGSCIQMKTNQFSIGYEMEFPDAFPPRPALRDNAIESGTITDFHPLFIATKAEFPRCAPTCARIGNLQYSHSPKRV